MLYGLGGTKWCMTVKVLCCVSRGWWFKGGSRIKTLILLSFLQQRGIGVWRSSFAGAIERPLVTAAAAAAVAVTSSCSASCLKMCKFGLNYQK
ncbi:hypothetical protein TSUD_221670 [Trifolium subterraneum]|uniref:Uncharacterized protein n=1 Tax=Trifolium subterraneum TaxID=3900 RepID=A0A2Z6NQF8_TRISU|nr:hypothetical protein TSUD_221670 [Trifolium subterraneum]